MFSRRETYSGLFSIGSLQPLSGILLLLLLSVPSAACRLFSARSRRSGEVIVMMDIRFTINVSVGRGGQELDSKRFLETDVKSFNLYETRKNLLQFDLVFGGKRGKDAGFLKYRFHRQEEESQISYMLRFAMKPDVMFRNLTHPLPVIEFMDPYLYSKYIGYADMSFKRDKNETIIFKLDTKEREGYSYYAEMETTYFHVQAFGMRHGEFGPVQHNTRDSVSPNSDLSPLVVGCVVGGVLFLLLVAAGVILWRRHLGTLLSFQGGYTFSQARDGHG
ncbi:hypothetical protein RRG08_009751 [Elysia crispata]|uniref:Uncharacterized protein n=1 Tax=Elysia crispata TaxID=231223 RepID=A0AAE0YZ20_9GAST|nr:hypothetical protein RRG08_009751 [Elysia crispata]